MQRYMCVIRQSSSANFTLPLPECTDMHQPMIKSQCNRCTPIFCILKSTCTNFITSPPHHSQQTPTASFVCVMQPVRAATVGVRHIASLSATGPVCAANTDQRNVRSPFGKFKVFHFLCFRLILRLIFPPRQSFYDL